MKVQVLIPFLIYLIILGAFGIITTRKVSHGMQAFFLGGKRISSFVTAVSSAVSVRGAWLILGLTATAYSLGLSSIWVAIGFIISDFLVFVLIGPKLRKFSLKQNSLTLADFLTSHFKNDKKILRVSVSVSLIIFSMIFITAHFASGGTAFFAIFDLAPTNGIIMTGMIVLLFTFSGGFKTLSNSDIFQAIIILSVLLILPITILVRTVGIGNIHAEILTNAPGFFNLKILSIGSLIGFFSIGISSFGNPAILVKLMAISPGKSTIRAALVNSATSILMSVGAISLGILGRVYFPSADSIPGASSQNVFIGLCGNVFSPIMLGIALVSIFAVIISSTGSQILLSASAITSDIYEKTLRNGQHQTNEKLSFYSKIVMAILVYIAVLSAIFFKMDYTDYLLFSLAGMGASMGPAIILSITWKGATSGGVSAGVVIGALSVIVWKSIPFLSGIVYELFPGVLFSFLAIWAGSQADKKLKSRKFNRKATYGDIKTPVSWE